jgi:hypothetical protein
MTPEVRKMRGSGPTRPERNVDAILRETAAAVVGGAVAGHQPTRGLAVCNLHDLAEATNAIKGGLARARPDVIVLTEEIHGALTKGVQVITDGLTAGLVKGGVPDLFEGVPVFRSPSNKEALEKAEELRLGGRRVHCYMHVPKKVEELLSGPDEIMRVQTADSIDPRTCPPGSSPYDMSPEAAVRLIHEQGVKPVEEKFRNEIWQIDPAAEGALGEAVRNDSSNEMILAIKEEGADGRSVEPGSAGRPGQDDASGQEAQGGAGGVGEAVDHQLPDGERVPGDRDQQRGHEGGQPLHPVQQDQRVQ